MRLVVVALALSFLWFGVWAILTTSTAHALRLAGLGLAAGLTLPGPNLGTWNGVKDHIQLAAMVLLTLLLLRFFLLFPRAKLRGKGHMVTLFPYLLWVALVLCLVLELIFHPRFYHSFGGFAGILMLGYGVLALAAVIHTCATAPRWEITDSGMGIVLWGAIAALVPNAARVLAWYLPPDGFDFPGSSYLPLLLVLFPMALALGVRKEARTLDPPWEEIHSRPKWAS